MYLKHYNLTLKPFELSLDPKFLWLGEKHKETLAAMKDGILENKGFISLTGDVGIGKTTLVNSLANTLEDYIIFAQVLDPALEKLHFLNLTVHASKINQKLSTKGDFLCALRYLLNSAYDHRQKVVLIIEEAQRFNQERLEELRLILNLQPDKQLINIIFVGQSEFESTLKNNKPLLELISFSHKLKPLQEFESKQYVIHRLNIAGSENEVFSSGALREIYSFTKGNPRLINIICDFALSTGFAKKVNVIEPEIIIECAANILLPNQQKKDAIQDLRASEKSIPETETGIQPGTSGNSVQNVAKKVSIKPAGPKLARVAPMFVVILLSIFGYLYFFGENHAPYRILKTFLGQSRSGDDEPAADLKELKNANARVAELESEAAMREQKLLILTEELDREKKNGLRLSSELSSKEGLIAELQQKLENPQPNNLEFEDEIENRIIHIRKLEGQLLKLKLEMASPETLLGRLRARNEELTANLEELKGVKERVAVLEGELAERDQAISLSEQRFSHLAKELDQEKKSRELLSSELAIKAAQVSEFRQKLQVSQSNQQELEKTIKKSENEIAKLRNQLRGLETLEAPTEPSAIIDDEKKKSTWKSEAFKERDESTRPSDIIDWFPKKKEK